MTDIRTDIQKLTPGELMEFFELDGTGIGAGIVRFHGITGHGALFWQTLEYSPWAINASGFARTSDQQPRPKLLVANVDGSISYLCQLFDDMVGAKLIRRRTFGKYMDGQPEADPTQEFEPEVWFIERKSGENEEAVEFELVSPLDFQGVKLPRRQIIANQCPWTYRDAICNYTGDPVATELDVPTTDPDLDKCGKRPASCKLRDWPDGQLNYGGFAAAGLMRT